ncbi:hypothetical protein [Aeromonas media]|uniref:hypothetical protein n=1 Tax=Aeromonas media TaxID=651 RepID=UPI003D1BBBEF
MSKSDIEKRRIAACLAVCEGEEFTIERLESGAFHLRSLVDSAFCSSQAHAETMGKLMTMTERKDELLAALEQAGEKMVAADIDGALEIIKNAAAKERQR